jgi:hypothetical protein
VERKNIENLLENKTYRDNFNFSLSRKLGYRNEIPNRDVPSMKQDHLKLSMKIRTPFNKRQDTRKLRSVKFNHIDYLLHITFILFRTVCTNQILQVDKLSIEPSVAQKLLRRYVMFDVGQVKEEARNHCTNICNRNF